MTEMTQKAPFPTALSEIVAELTYRPGWRIHLIEDCERGQGSEGLTLAIYTVGYDTYNVKAGQVYRVVHYFIVPAANYNRRSWLRWVFERLHDVELHECMEFFQVAGERPFAPNHGPGHDPYYLRELNRVEDAETTFRGERREGSQGVYTQEED